LVADKDTTIRDLRQLLLPPSTEKTREILKKLGINVNSGPIGAPGATAPTKTEAEKKPGHGRNGAEEYQGAHRVEVQRERMTPGDRCPDCYRGKMHEQQEPKRLVRIVGKRRSQRPSTSCRNSAVISAAGFTRRRRRKV
jgi:hypothetical protein